MPHDSQAELVAVRPDAELAHPLYLLLARLRSPRTRQAYLGALGAFAGLVQRVTGLDGHPAPGDPWAVDWAELGYAEWSALRAELEHTPRLNRITGRAAPPSASTLNLYLTAARRLLGELVNMDAIGEHDYRRRLRALASVKAPPKPPAGRMLDGGEVLRVIDAVRSASSEAARLRDMCAVAILYSTGCRASELVGLDRCDVLEDETGTAIRFRITKGGRERTTPLDDAAAEHVKRWLAHRGEIGPALLCAVRRGGRVLSLQRLGYDGLRALLARIRQRSGVRHFTAHDWRRTCVSRQLERTDIATVARLVGHVDVSTTQRYDRRGDETLRAAARLDPFPAGV